MNKKQLRHLALLLLNSPHGINSEAYELLVSMLHVTGDYDILDVIATKDGYYFIGEDDFEDLKGKE